MTYYEGPHRGTNSDIYNCFLTPISSLPDSSLPFPSPSFLIPVVFATHYFFFPPFSLPALLLLTSFVIQSLFTFPLLLLSSLSSPSFSSSSFPFLDGCVNVTMLPVLQRCSAMPSCFVVIPQLLHVGRRPPSCYELVRSRCCNKLFTSGFVDNVMFLCNGPYGSVKLSQQPRCNVVHGLTPLLCGIGCILS